MTSLATQSGIWATVRTVIKGIVVLTCLFLILIFLKPLRDNLVSPDSWHFKGDSTITKGKR